MYEVRVLACAILDPVVNTRLSCLQGKKDKDKGAGSGDGEDNEEDDE